MKDKAADKELASIADTITGAADRYWTVVYMMIIALADGLLGLDGRLSLARETMPRPSPLVEGPLVELHLLD